MNLFALLLGLGLERLLTQLFHLREFRWLDPLFDALFSRCAHLSRWTCALSIAGGALGLTLPVIVVSVLLGDHWLALPYFIFAVLILLFSLGPRDLKEEVDEYCAAVDSGEPDDIRQLSRELLEADPPAGAVERDRAVEAAVFVQANNRIFGVVFWFLMLGPAGAWLFRVLDLMRRRASYRYGDMQAQETGTVTVPPAVATVHGLLAWIPARLLAAGYALAGGFEEAVAGWRACDIGPASRFYVINNDVLAAAGAGASAHSGERTGARPGAPVRAAMNLVIRTLWLIWCPVIAVLTLYDLVT